MNVETIMIELREELDDAQSEIIQLRAENKALREAAQAERDACDAHRHRMLKELKKLQLENIRHTNLTPPHGF